MRRVWGSLPALADLVLVLAALLGGAGVSHVLLPPVTLRVHLESRLLTSSVETPALVRSSPLSEI